MTVCVPGTSASATVTSPRLATPYARPSRSRPARNAAWLPSSASTTTPVSVKPARRTVRTCADAIRHFSRTRTVAGMPAVSQRAGSVVHDTGRYRSNASGHVRPSAINALETATWQLPIVPSAPQYWRCTPTDCVPCFGNGERTG